MLVAHANRVRNAATGLEVFVKLVVCSKSQKRSFNAFLHESTRQLQMRAPHATVHSVRIPWLAFHLLYSADCELKRNVRQVCTVQYNTLSVHAKWTVNSGLALGGTCFLNEGSATASTIAQ